MKEKRRNNFLRKEQSRVFHKFIKRRNTIWMVDIGSKSYWLSIQYSTVLWYLRWIWKWGWV